MPKSAKSKILTAGLLSALIVAPINAQAALKGILDEPSLWATYKQRFVKQNGRVIDNANKNITHSEGQGFAMLMALAANDPVTFERMWQFTRENMMVRSDNLISWKWTPRGFSRVPDKNNASDGDLLVAWALLEASKAGWSQGYANSAKEILRDLRKLIKADQHLGFFMRPGAFGFTAGEHNGQDIINISYWVFPALERLTVLTGDKVWEGLARSGEAYLARASNNKSGLPADWNTLRRNKGVVGLSRKFTTEFSYNAVRVPLYLAWSSRDRSTSLKRFHSNWVGRSGTKLNRVDVKRNRVRGTFGELGYRAIAAVVDCSVQGKRFPSNLRTKLDKHYYPASLHLLSIIATKQRYPQCW